MIAAKPDTVFDVYAEVIMKVSSIINLRSESPSVKSVLQTVDVILKAAFEKANFMDKMPILDNSLLIYMGLLKVVIGNPSNYDRSMILLNIFTF